MDIILIIITVIIMITASVMCIMAFCYISDGKKKSIRVLSTIYLSVYICFTIASVVNNWWSSLSDSTDSVYDDWEEGYNIGYDSGYDAFLQEIFEYKAPDVIITNNRWNTNDFSLTLDLSDNNLSINITNPNNITYYRVFYKDTDNIDFYTWDSSIGTYTSDFYPEEVKNSSEHLLVYEKELPQNAESLYFLIVCNDNSFYTAQYIM